jgi:hypothetical protein
MRVSINFHPYTRPSPAQVSPFAKGGLKGDFLGDVIPSVAQKSPLAPLFQRGENADLLSGVEREVF